MKDKFSKYWPQIFIFIFNIAIGQTIVYLINKNTIDSEFVTDIITRIIDILIAILNFIFVIYIFKKEQDEKTTAKEDSKIEKKNNYSLYCYQTFILPDSIEYIRHFYEELNILLETGFKSQKGINPEKLKKYTLLHNECKSKITEILRIISKSTYQNIIDSFKDFQDEFNSSLFDNGSSEELKKIASKYKTNMMEILYKYEVIK